MRAWPIWFLCVLTFPVLVACGTTKVAANQSIPVTTPNTNITGQASLINTAPYFTVSKSMTYLMTDGSRYWKYTNKGEQSLDGRIVYVVSNIATNKNGVPKSGMRPQTEYYYIDSSDNVWSVTIDGSGNPAWSADTLLAPAHAKVGHQYVTKYGTFMRDKLIPLQQQSIVLPNGKRYEDCLVFDFEEDTSSGTSGGFSPIMYSRSYYAKGVGLVLTELGYHGFSKLSEKKSADQAVVYLDEVLP